MKLNDHFIIQEFVPQIIYDRFRNNSIWFVDPVIIDLATAIREYFGKPMTINNWHRGGERIYSGFRPGYCQVGAPLSQHRFGRAIDFVIPGLDPEEIRGEIMDHFLHFAPYGLTTLELNTPTWTHVDIRPTDTRLLYLIRPE